MPYIQDHFVLGVARILFRLRLRSVVDDWCQGNPWRRLELLYCKDPRDPQGWKQRDQKVRGTFFPREDLENMQAILELFHFWKIIWFSALSSYFRIY